MIYLDNAATSFIKPEGVVKAVCETTYKNSANAGRGGYSAAIKSSEILYETREKLARVFGINNPERIVFCKNTTEALNFGIKGVMHKGGHIITTSMEHNSVIRPIKALEQNGVFCFVLQGDKDGNIDVEKLEKMIKPQTKMIIMTHSSNVCGNIYNIEKAAEIAHKHRVLFMVDAAQSAGSIPVFAKNIDLLAFPGHKGLLGPMGTGGLYVREGVNIKPLTEGGTGSLSESLLQPDFFPDMLESGTQNVPAIAGLGAACDFLLKNGIQNIHNYEKELRERFEEKVLNMENIKVYGGNHKTAITAMNIKGADCIEVAQRLADDYGICVRSGLHCAILAHKTLGIQNTGCVRFSFGYFNTPKEIDAAADAVYKISKDLQKCQN
ncbi:MAG: aminotransferase class V-fold PLP-dependent enzyme [Clostridia bacterium]|nr:aminotransferase class V-fold PLP-dependent enzyme [Clostridia bacterium]